MSFDLFQSRANYNELCKWWSRNEKDAYDSDSLIMKRIPSGQFVAKEVTPQTWQDSGIGNDFQYDRSLVTIKSPDDLSNIKNKDLVEYQGSKWIVVSVQKSKSKMQNTLFAEDRHCSHYWYLELRK